MKQQILRQCQDFLPSWRGLSFADFSMEDPKGFSSFTLSIRAPEGANPPAVLYRKLEGKENAILDFEAEKEVFLLLGNERIAAQCYEYNEDFRLEEFYEGRTLTAEDLQDPVTLRNIAEQLHRFHQLTPENLPEGSFFELLHQQWGAMAREVLEEKFTAFPPNEQEMCVELREIYSESTLKKVLDFLPDEELTFSHNDTYHGNIMKLDNDEIRLLDFEFSCLNHKAFDFSNLFAETVMKHKQPEYPFFRIGEPEFSEKEVRTIVEAYVQLDNLEEAAHLAEVDRLVNATLQMIPLSHFMYAMAALPLSLEPIQKIRFIPYASMRFQKFLECWEEKFGE